ncbi:MAG: hypothetical protein WAP47_16440 [Candidatus Rokuibacteriota bacterium]
MLVRWNRAFASFAAAAGILLGTLSGPPMANAALFGLGDDDKLYTINTATGAATFVADVPGTSLVGLTFLGGTLYASDIFGSSLLFGTINPTTGAYTGISDQGGSANWHGLAGNESAGLIYTIDINDGNKLKSITPGGVITTIGSGAGIDGRGMGYDDLHGILYATSGGDSSLYTVDVTTGGATLIGALGIDAGTIGLDYDEASQILYANDGQVSDSLYTVNVTTGAATLVGSNGGEFEINGLAWITDAAPVPLPGTGGLVLLGMAVLAALARRRSVAC